MESFGSTWSLIWGTSNTVRAIMILLAAMSLVSWAVMLEKYLRFKRTRAESVQFLSYFQEKGITERTMALAETLKNSPEARVFMYGYNELMSLLGDKNSPYIIDPNSPVNGEVSAIQIPSGLVFNMTALAQVIEKYIDGVIPLEINRLESRLNFLATTSAVGPLLGLFGTVWGILGSFRGIASQQSASIATVAPGISEALVTTVAGLIAAIPALVGFNMLMRYVRRSSVELDCFMSHFLVRLQSRGIR